MAKKVQFIVELVVKILNLSIKSIKQTLVQVAQWCNDRASDSRPNDHGFDSQPGHYQETTLGKLFTPTKLVAAKPGK